MMLLKTARLCVWFGLFWNFILFVLPFHSGDHQSSGARHQKLPESHRPWLPSDSKEKKCAIGGKIAAQRHAFSRQIVGIPAPFRRTLQQGERCSVVVQRRRMAGDEVMNIVILFKCGLLDFNLIFESNPNLQLRPEFIFFAKFASNHGTIGWSRVVQHAEIRTLVVGPPC
jgi:hypothetical protein